MIQQAAISQHPTLRSSRLKKHLMRGLIAGLVAVGLNGLLYLIATSTLGGLFIQAGQGNESITLGSILAFSFFPSILAAVLFWVLARFTQHSKAIFLSVAAMVFVGFFFGPLNAASNSFTLWTLELMHVAAALPIVLMILRAKRST